MLQKLKHIILILFLFSGVISNQACFGQLVISNQGGTAQDLVDAMIGFGLNTSNATISCPSNAYGTFTNGASTDIGIPTGLVLTTGDVNDLNAPGSSFMSTDNWSSCNDPQLASLEPAATNDCCILEFDVIPTCNQLQIRFVFGSEEYPEWVSAGFNDAFGFFISGPDPSGGNYNNDNVALLPDGVTIVSIDNVNANLNSAYYVDNSAGQTNVFDAFTTVLISEVSVVPCESYHFKIAIADAGDGIFDSGVFIDFLECVNALEPVLSSTPAGCSGDDGTATVDLTGGFPPYTISWNTNPIQTGATATGLAPGTYEVTVDDAGACTDPITQMVVVSSTLNNITPTFNQEGPYCEGDAIPNLPILSNEGITGVWSPAIDNTQTTTYTFTPDPGQCADPVTMDVIINPSQLASFTQVGPYCIGDVIPELSTISVEGITGSWSPSIDNSQTTIYTFTPDIGQCSNTETMEIVINALSLPTFNQQGPYCIGEVIPELNTISNEGISGQWSPAIDNSQTTLYTFTPDIGQCSNTQTMEIVINALTLPTFNQQGPYCIGDIIPELNTISNEGISGQWSPVIDNSQTATYTFTPDPGQCSNTQTMEIIVDVSITPSFMQQGPYCEGDIVPSIPTISNENISGQWSPAINNSQTTTYTFTPDLGQCATPQTMEIIIDILVTPTFDQVGPYCEGSNPPPLTTVSLEGIEGVWGPPGINTGITGPSLFAFVPNPGQCASNQFMEIFINPLQTPTFDQVGPFCVGSEISDLNPVSVEGLTGSWSPAIDNTQTTEYTFTPDANQCASTQTLIVTVDLPSPATFDLIPPICSGSELSLPVSSVEGYTGSWSPEINNLETTSYTFTPDENQCALNNDLTVEVLANPIISAGDEITVCIGDIASLSASGAGPNGQYNWENGIIDGESFVVNETTIYTVTGIDENGCVGTASVQVTGLPAPLASFSANPESGAVPLEVIFTNNSQNASSYEWDFGNGQFVAVNDEGQQSMIYQDFGIFDVWLIADNGFCADSISLEISTTLGPSLYVPNVFTPNDDNSNDVFMISTENMQSIELLIVNRWGNLMATIDDVNSGWDGKMPNGNDAKEGVYFYKYFAVGLDGSEWEGHGFLTLIR